MHLTPFFKQYFIDLTENLKSVDLLFTMPASNCVKGKKKAGGGKEQHQHFTLKF